MTTGIYQLTFSSNRRYIGKALDIENRYGEHKASFLSNKASNKMQHEFKVYGMPALNVLLECHPDHLDVLETALIAEWEPELNTAKKYPVEDIEILIENSQYLNYSTSTLLQMIITNLHEIKELKDTVKELTSDKDTEIRKCIKVEGLTSLAEHYRTMAIGFESEIDILSAELDKERKKPWWKKLLGM